MDLTELTTYQALVYQSRANRQVKAQFEKILREYNLTMMQWSVLGFIKDAGKKGIRISDLAIRIDTSLAFITNSVNALEKKGIVQRAGHETDNRAKLVSVSPTHRKKLATIEDRLRHDVGAWVRKRLTEGEIETHIKALQDLARDTE